MLPYLSIADSGVNHAFGLQICKHLLSPIVVWADTLCSKPWGNKLVRLCGRLKDILDTHQRFLQVKKSRLEGTANCVTCGLLVAFYYSSKLLRLEARSLVLYP